MHTGSGRGVRLSLLSLIHSFIHSFRQVRSCEVCSYVLFLSAALTRQLFPYRIERLFRINNNTSIIPFEEDWSFILRSCCGRRSGGRHSFSIPGPEAKVANRLLASSPGVLLFKRWQRTCKWWYGGYRSRDVLDA